MDDANAAATAARAEVDLTKQQLTDAIENNATWQSYSAAKEIEFNGQLAGAESQLQTKELEISTLRIQLAMLESPAAFATKK